MGLRRFTRCKVTRNPTPQYRDGALTAGEGGRGGEWARRKSSGRDSMSRDRIGAFVRSVRSHVARNVRGTINSYRSSSLRDRVAITSRLQDALLHTRTLGEARSDRETAGRKRRSRFGERNRSTYLRRELFSHSPPWWPALVFRTTTHGVFGRRKTGSRMR